MPAAAALGQRARGRQRRQPDVGPTIERASPADLMAFATDVSGAPVAFAAVLLLESDSGVDLAAVRDALRDRVRAVPRLRQRLVRAPRGCGRPYWVDDPHFAIGNHVRTVDCPPPGDQAALLGLASDTVNRRLPLSRPLWSATLVAGLAGGGTALIVVAHHVLADGVGGLAILARLVDGAPDTSSAIFPRRPPSRRALFVEALRARLRAVGRLPEGVRRLRAAMRELASGVDLRPPRCSLNTPTGACRRLAVARVDLASARAAGHAHSATVNDVVLTAVAGALHAVLRARGETADRFVISVPIAARREASATHLGNDVGVVPVAVPAAGDPLLRLAAIARITRERKAGGSGLLERPARAGVSHPGHAGRVPVVRRPATPGHHVRQQCPRP